MDKKGAEAGGKPIPIAIAIPIAIKQPERFAKIRKDSRRFVVKKGGEGGDELVIISVISG